MDINSEIIELQKRLELNFPKAEAKVYHHFADGVYIREMRAEAGSVIVGQKHKTEHISQLISGDCLMKINESEKLYSGYTVVVSPPSTKKVIICLTDIILTNVFPADTCDLNKLRENLIDVDYENLVEAQLRHEIGDSVWRG